MKIIWAKNSEFIYDNYGNLIVKNKNAFKEYSDKVHSNM